MKISVIIPAYNEEGNIIELTNRLKRIFTGLKIKFELIFIIQGEDGAFEKLKKLKKKISQLRLFHYSKPLGIGPAFVKGFNKISKGYDYVLTMDADLNHQPEEIPLFIERIKKQPHVDIVIGSRNIPKGKMVLNKIRYRWIKKMLSNSINYLMPSMYGLNIKDITSGYRLFKLDVIKRIRNKITSKNFEMYPEILILSKRCGFRMTEVPIIFKDRVKGKSKLNFIISGFGYIKLFFRLMFNSRTKEGV